MLPLEVELDLFAWMNISRDLLSFIPLLLIIVYIAKKAQDDEMWIGRRFAHMVSLMFVLYLVMNMLAPFLIMSFLYPELMFEIGEKIVSLFLGGVVIVIFIILALEIAQHKGLFHKK